MVGAIKEICIFVIIAQAVMFFVPGNSYMKYVRILVGILMILKITEPILGLILDEEKEKEIRDRILLLEQDIDLSSELLNLEDNRMGIYESITDELKSQLNDCESGYEVIDAEITENQKLVITVREMERQEKDENGIQIETIVIGGNASQRSNISKEKEKELKEVFGKSISVDPESIMILNRD